MSEKPTIPGPQYTWDEGLGVSLALGQHCLAELRALERTPGPEGKRGPAGDNGERGERGEPGKAGPSGKDGVDGKDGERGQKGEPGRNGMLPVVTVWKDGQVHYEGAVVTHDNGTWQAKVDTGSSPPHEDWICLARAGRDGMDGASFKVCGTWSADKQYKALNVVVINGGGFVAKRDDPGPCPGDGWQLMASQGKQGKPGEKGLQGPPGKDAAEIVGMDLDETGMLTLLRSDGKVVQCDMAPLFTRMMVR